MGTRLACEPPRGARLPAPGLGPLLAGAFLLGTGREEASQECCSLRCAGGSFHQTPSRRSASFSPISLKSQGSSTSLARGCFLEQKTPPRAPVGRKVRGARWREGRGSERNRALLSVSQQLLLAGDR